MRRSSSTFCLVLCVLCLKLCVALGVDDAHINNQCPLNFVVKRDCNWERQWQCGPRLYNITFRVADADIFPTEELLPSIQAAGDLWPRVNRRKSSSRRETYMYTVWSDDQADYFGLPIGTRLDVEGVFICLEYTDFGKSPATLLA